MPTTQHILQLHHKYAPTPAALEKVYGHCQIVWDIAEQLILRNNLHVDVELVKAGCLLHDIGVYALKAGEPYILHGVRGEELLQHEGLPETLQKIASHHTGVGISEQDIVTQALPLPSADYFAETPEERLVMYADKFHSKGQILHFNSAASYADHVGKFGIDKTERFMAMVQEYGEPDLEMLSKKYNQPIDPANS